MSEGKNRVSLFSVIGSACGNLGITNVNQHLDNFARWAAEAEAKIGSRNSKKRYECEIEVKNRRACLPQNFINLIAIKYGNEIIDLTRRDFRMFNKAPQKGVALGDQKFISGNLNYNTPGQVLAMRVTFSGVYATLDVITLTVSLNNCGTISPNTFTYVVQVADTLTTIATNVAALINAIPNLGYEATSGAGLVDLIADNTNITFVITPYTNSAAGTIATTITQNHVKPKTVNITNETCEVNPETTSKNLANLNAAEINTGNLSMSNTLNDFFGNSPNASVFTIDNGYIFCNFVDNGKIGISYEGVWLDENGWPTIDQGHEDAVVHYCMFMYSMAEFKAGKISQAYFYWVEKRWYWLCAQVRGNDEMPNEAEMNYLANMWCNLLPTPSKNVF